jgi:hypothetical protein
VVFIVCGGIVELALNESVNASSMHSKELTLGDPADNIDLDVVSSQLPEATSGWVGDGQVPESVNWPNRLV